MQKLLFVLAGAALLAGTAFLLTQSAPGYVAPEGAAMMANFKAWQLEYGKKFASPEQEVFRFQVYSENFERIQAHNANTDKTFLMAQNQFMDLTHAEFAQTYLNLQVPEIEVEEVDQELTVSAVDWVSKGDVTGVKNQGSCGSCWAFSAVGALESFSILSGKGHQSFSEQQLVDCSRAYGNQGCNGGWMDQAFNYIQKNGITSAAQYPYTGRDGTCRFNGGNFKISGHTDSPAGNCNSVINNLQGRPLSVAVDATNWSFYAGGVFKNCAASLNHGVLLVGVDTAGTWKVKNSWGTGWGQGGYINLAAGNTCGICNAASWPH